MSQKFSTHGYTFISVVDAGQVSGSCYNCGLGIRYMALFKHNATGTIVHIGQTCMANATPEQKRAFSHAERLARLARKVEKYLATDPIAQRLVAYCESNPKSEDKTSDNWLLHLKLDHIRSQGYLNEWEDERVESLLSKVVA